MWHNMTDRLKQDKEGVMTSEQTDAAKQLTMGEHYYC